MNCEEIPELWGPAEVVDFARTAVQEKTPGADISERAVQRWLTLPDFPAPAVNLKMGPVFLAEDVRPWVYGWLSRSGIRPGRVGNALPEKIREEIAAAKGRLTMAEAAATFGVALSTVSKIWRNTEGRRSESQSS